MEITSNVRPRRNRPGFALWLSAALLLLPPAVQATPAFKVETVASGLQHPWALAFLPNGEILVSERVGRLRRIVDGELLDEPVSGVPEVYAEGEGGFQDIALHPDFEDNHWLYFSYSHHNDEGNTTRLARAHYQDGHLTDRELLFEASPRENTTQHFGSRITFDQEGHLYLTVGDLGNRGAAQDLGQHAGSTIRLNMDGSVPEDNPFVDREGAKPEIYTYGNRNAEGMTRHPETGEIWQHEHGPRGGDEINVVKKGANYGWPAITYGIDYDGSIISDRTHAPGMEQPLHYWDPSIAPSGMDFYEGDMFPEWKGDLFVGALAGRKLVRLDFDGHELVEEEALLEDRGERIREVVSGPDGAIWLLTDAPDGKVLRLIAP